MPDPHTTAEPTPLAQARSPRLLLGALVALATGGLVYLVVLSGLARPWDEALLARLRLPPEAPDWLREALRDLTALGSFTVLGLAVVAVTLVLAARARTRLAGLFMVSALGATAFSSLIKIAADRARPGAEEALALTFTRSFPSGHALLTAAILLTCSGFLALATPQRSARHLNWALAIVLCLLVGLSRLLLGVHWPTDVLAGWCFGLGWALLTLHLASTMLGAGNFRA